MKVKAKQLLFSSLPNAKKGKKLPKAQPGKRHGETGMAPIGIPDDYFDKFIKPTQVQDPVDLTPAPDTSKIKLPQVPTAPPGYQPPQERRPSLGNKGLNPGQAALLGLAAFDAVLPDWYPKYTPAQPQVGYNPNLYGTGSQAIAQSGTQVAYRRDIAPMPNPSRGRTNPPIYTQDPNDPRIQPYRDSLTLHNYSNKAAELSKRESIPIKEWKALVGGINPEAVRSAYKRLGGPDDIGQLPINVVTGDKNKEVEAYVRLYKKPVQPVIYRPRRPVVASDVQDIVPIDRPISVEGGGFKPIDLSQKPTKYSATIRDESAPGQQRTVYFKTKKEWQNFKDSGAVNVASSAETADSATAAGYRTMKKGGWIQKATASIKRRGTEGVCTGEKFGSSSCPPGSRRYNLAKTFRKMAKKRKKADGGIIPDNMGIFYPAKYEHGGCVDCDSCAEHVSMVGPDYPNVDLMEQLLVYNAGGSVNTTGYRDGGPTASNPYNIIPTGDISMQGVSQPIIARPINGDQMGDEFLMLPGQDYNFDADAVLEYPLAKAGLSAAKAKEMLRDGKANGKKLTAKQKRYFGMVAAGKAQTGQQVNNFDAPGARTSLPPEAFYQASATLGHYKGILNEKLKAKNPQAFGDYFKGLTALRRSGKLQDALKYVQETPYDEYLTPDEVRGTLGEDHYQQYLNALKEVNAYEVQQGRQPLYGTKEGAGDLSTLNYGRRFASLQVTPSLTITNTGRGTKYNRQYTYDPNTMRTSFSETGDLSLRPTGLTAPPETATASLKNGGVMYDNGGQIGTMWGGSSKLAAYNPYDGGTVEFQGASHDNGGIGMHYNGTPVEVEGGEFAAQDQAGNLNIFGNMYLPGTRTKFKTVAKKIAEKEKQYDRLKTNGSQYVNEANPADKFEKLKFNSGMVMMQGGERGQRDLAQKKENLSALQKAMLDTAAEFGLDAEKMSAGKIVRARKGARIKKYQPGDPINDPTMADRNNNPGNIKWGKFAKRMGAKKGPPAPDGGNFAVFPTREKGLKAMERLLTSDSYKNLDVDAAITKWTGGHPYKYDLPSLRGKKVKDLTPQERAQMMESMIVGEGTRYGPGVARSSGTPTATPIQRAPVPEAPPFTPYGLPNTPPFRQDPQRKRPATVEPPYDELNPPGDQGPLPSNVEPLHVNQILGEIYAAATNSVEPVPAQRYEPQLFQPYQVSFQDRLNLNQNTFNALRRAVGTTNPSALGELAAQKYAADTGVKADEFRTNQAIANDVTNRNVALLNDANLKNLAIADTQMMRQSQARSNTRAVDQMIINSLSSKFMQNRYENKRLAAYENLYDYRFVPQEDGGLKATYYGPNAMFNFSGSRGTGQPTGDTRTVTRYDQYGNVKGYTEYDDFELRDMQRALDLEMKRRNLPLMEVAPLNKK